MISPQLNKKGTVVGCNKQMFTIPDSKRRCFLNQQASVQRTHVRPQLRWNYCDLFSGLLSITAEV